MSFAVSTKSFAAAAFILLSWMSSLDARMAGGPETPLPLDPPVDSPEESCEDESLEVVVSFSTCFDDASVDLLDAKVSMAAPASDVDPAEIKILRKEAKRGFKKANKKCSKKLRKALERIQRDKPCPAVEPNKVTETILVCAMDEIPYLTCAEEAETLLNPPTIVDRPGGGLCCPADEEPGVGFNPSCPNGQPPKCCPNGGYWGCGTEKEGEYFCGEQKIWMYRAELGSRCDHSFCNTSIKIECPPIGSGVYISPDPSNGCRLPMCPFN